MLKLFAMGDYGAYVWVCFALTLAVLLFNEWRIRARHAAVWRAVKARMRALAEHDA